MSRLTAALERRFPGAVQWLRAARATARRLARLRYYLHDIATAARHMRWDRPQLSYWQLSSALLFQYHKLEKGLCMPGPSRFFGDAPAAETLRLVQRWQAAGHDLADPIHQGAVQALLSYRDKVRPFAAADPRARRTVDAIDAGLRGTAVDPALATPAQRDTVHADAWQHFDALTQARRSVRSFKDSAVPRDKIERAIAAAQRSPSVCNRQAWHVHAYAGRRAIDELLLLQNGNRGFGHTVPLLLILTADAAAFFDASERNQPFLDGGLFAMSLLYALQSQGLATCCLNWCVAPATDRAAHAAAGIDERERILMFLAVGDAADGSGVARSPRRAQASMLHFH